MVYIYAFHVIVLYNAHARHVNSTSQHRILMLYALENNKMSVNLLCLESNVINGVV